MRRWAWVAWMLGVQACGPEVATNASDAGSSSSGGGATSSSTSVTSAEVSSVSPSSADASSEATSTSDETGMQEPYICTPGTFVGLYSVGFESAGFESCDTGEWWAFWGGGNEACPLDMWITVEGEVCGPVPFGLPGGGDYELKGEIIQGPCEASCGETPEPSACSSFLALCPTYECDPGAQDCPDGERCTPVSAEDAPPWTGATCAPIEEPAHPIGSACASEGGWRDDCVAGAHCVIEDGDAGTCAALCFPADGGACELGTCWPCEFADAGIQLGVCGVDEVAC